MIRSIKRRRHALLRLTTSLVLVLSTTLPAAAQVVLLTDWRGERHMNCLKEVERDPNYGMQLAEDWVKASGGAAARHCLAVAEAEIGDPSKAARDFAAIAQDLPDDRWGDVGQLWAQAGHAWLLAEEPDKALEAFDLAVEYRPNDAGLHADRGVTRALVKNYGGAVTDFTRALDLAGNHPDYLLYRATAYRYLDELELGLADLDLAISTAPDFAEAYLERGTQRAITGDDVGAAADFQAVLDIAPKGDLAPLAAKGLSQVTGG